MKRHALCAAMLTMALAAAAMAQRMTSANIAPAQYEAPCEQCQDCCQPVGIFPRFASLLGGGRGQSHLASYHGVAQCCQQKCCAPTCCAPKGCCQKPCCVQKGCCAPTCCAPKCAAPCCVQKGCCQKGCCQKGCCQKGCCQKGCCQKGCCQKGCCQKGCCAPKCCAPTCCAPKGCCGCGPHQGLLGAFGLFHRHQECYPVNYSGPEVPQPEMIEGDPFRDDPARTGRTAEVFGTGVRR